MKFSELTPARKERLRGYVRQHWIGDGLDFESEIDGIKRVFGFLGIEDPKHVEYDVGGNGGYFRFEGVLRPKLFDLAGVKAYAPQDEELHGVAELLVTTLTALKLSGEGIEVYPIRRYGRASISTSFDRLDPVINDLCDWAHALLCSAYDYAYSDENVDAILEDREFEEDGSII